MFYKAGNRYKKEEIHGGDKPEDQGPERIRR